MVGRSIAETEPVRAFGNNNRGNTIPHNTPYKDKAFEEVKPYFSRHWGNEMVSMLAKRFTMIRLILMIIAIFNILIVNSLNSLRKSVVLYDLILCTEAVNRKTDKRVETASPQRSPVAAILKGGVRPLDVI